MSLRADSSPRVHVASTSSERSSSNGTESSGSRSREASTGASDGPPKSQRACTSSRTSANRRCARALRKASQSAATRSPPFELSKKSARERKVAPSSSPASIAMAAAHAARADVPAPRVSPTSSADLTSAPADGNANRRNMRLARAWAAQPTPWRP
eukprot:scaffold79944_cov29-Tisochrysis_lutea.AAC.2